MDDKLWNFQIIANHQVLRLLVDGINILVVITDDGSFEPKLLSILGFLFVRAKSSAKEDYWCFGSIFNVICSWDWVLIKVRFREWLATLSIFDWIV